MYIYEEFSEIDLYHIAEDLVEDSALPVSTLTEAMNAYLNSQPSSWRLISHSTKSIIRSHITHQFIWATGD